MIALSNREAEKALVRSTFTRGLTVVLVGIQFVSVSYMEEGCIQSSQCDAVWTQPLSCSPRAVRCSTHHAKRKATQLHLPFSSPSQLRCLPTRTLGVPQQPRNAGIHELLLHAVRLVHQLVEAALLEVTCTEVRYGRFWWTLNGEY